MTLFIFIVLVTLLGIQIVLSVTLIITAYNNMRTTYPTHPTHPT